MSELALGGLIEPVNTMSDEDWLEKLEDVSDDLGFFEPLGPDHSAIFVDRGSRLLVTFETIENARSRTGSDVPLGWSLADGKGWSQLCILAHSQTWFRHRAVFMFFDRLVDKAFFDRFDQVVFYGAKSCGYGASVFSVTAPGSTVIAIEPQATLNPRVTEWDLRFARMRRVSFTDRYGYAPDMLDAAENAYLLYDPACVEDAMHAALFTRQNVTKLRCRHLGGEIEGFLQRADILQPIIDAAMRGRLSAADFHRLFRERRHYLPYLRQLLSAVEDQRRPYLTGLLCRNVVQRMNTPRFRHHLVDAEKALADQNRVLPKPDRGAPVPA